MQLFFQLDAEAQDVLVEIAERFVQLDGGSEQDGEGLEPLRLVVGNKNGGK